MWVRVLNDRNCDVLCRLTAREYINHDVLCGLTSLEYINRDVLEKDHQLWG